METEIYSGSVRACHVLSPEEGQCQARGVWEEPLWETHETNRPQAPLSLSLSFLNHLGPHKLQTLPAPKSPPN